MLTPDAVRLDGQVALVTGAAAGIGAAVAGALAAFGADVALCDRDADGLAATVTAVEELGRRAPSGVLDVRDGDAVRAFVDRVVDTLGRIDVLVNNAGGGFRSAFLDVSEKGEAALIAENFTSVTGFVRAVAPHLPDGGSIVNITSIEAHRGGPGYAVYSAMKAAVASLTQSLACELGPRGVRVNCVAPDLIPTPGIGLDVPVAAPLGIAGHVDDVAGAVVYLASGLGRFVTGSTVHVDGGTSAASGWKRQPDGTWRT